MIKVIRMIFGSKILLVNSIWIKWNYECVNWYVGYVVRLMIKWKS